MSKINDALIGAQDAIRDVEEEALKRMEMTELLFESFPDLEKHLGTRSSRFSQVVQNMLKTNQHPEADNPFIGQVAYTWLIDGGRREENIEENLELEEEMRRDEELYG